MNYAGLTAGSALFAPVHEDFGIAPAAIAPRAVAPTRAAPIRGASSAHTKDAIGILSTPIGLAIAAAVLGAVGFVAWKKLGKKKGRRS